MIQNKRRIALARKTFFSLFALFLLTTVCLAGEEAAQPQTEPAPPPIRKPEPKLPAVSEEIPDWQARWELARVLSYAKRYDESVTEYRRLLKEKPNLLAAKLELAQVLYWHGKHDESFALINAIDSIKLDAASRLLLADLYAVRKEYGKAEAIYRAYLKDSPNDADVRIKLADLLSWQKKYEESLSILAKLLNETPDNIQMRRKYAFVLIWSGQHEQGAEELKKTLNEKTKVEPSPVQNKETIGSEDSPKETKKAETQGARNAADKERPVMEDPK